MGLITINNARITMGGGIERRNIVIDDGKIKQLTKSKLLNVDRSIDAHGCFVVRNRFLKDKVLSIIGILIVVLYGWRSWEIAKEELEKVFKAFADSLAKSFEK